MPDKRIEEYIITSANLEGDLAEQVNQSIREGLQPWGELIVNPVKVEPENEEDQGILWFFTQVMVRRR